MDSHSMTEARLTKQASRWAVLLVAGLLAATPALAAKPDGVGNDKDKKHEQVEKGESSHHNHGGTQVNVFLNDRQRSIIRDYYGREFKRGNCPPGLAKKNNGCMPPGQAKKWAKGKRLPDDVRYHDLPRDLLDLLGGAPEGHKYVRVAADVLLLTVGTSMVVDALEGLDSL
jgi:Ni/Co efflux regulator RcnB